MSNDTSKQVLVELGQKADAFCVHFTTLGAETFGRAERSAIAAGFAEASARNQATKLLKKPAVQARISELHKENMSRNFLTSDKVLNDLESVRLQAVEKGDLSAAIRASELQGKFLAMFVDRQQFGVDPAKQPELSERERAECLALAAIRLGCLSLPGDVGGGEGAVAILEGGEKRPEDIPHRPPEATRLDSTLPG